MSAPTSSTNSIDDLRAKLFGVLDALTDPNKAVDIERTKAVVSIAEQIIDSAKVQVDYLRVTGEGTAPFLEQRKTPQLPSLPNGGSADPMGQMAHQLTGATKGAQR